MKWIRVLLVIIAVACIGVALSYPIRYRKAQQENNSNMEDLAEMRARAQREQGIVPEGGGMPPVNKKPGADAQAPAEAGGQPDAKAPDEAEGTLDDGGSTEAEGASGMPKRPTLPPGESNGDPREPSQVGGEAQSGDAAAASQGAPQSGDGTDETGASNETGASGVSGNADTTGAIDATGASGVSGDAETTGATGAAGGSGAANPGNADAVTASDAQPAQTGQGQPEPTPVPEPTPEPTPTPVPTPTPTLGIWDLLLDGDALMTPTPTPQVTPTPRMAETPVPKATPVWDDYKGPLPYPMLEKVAFDESAILPELREIYALNNDLVGWITIPDTVIDYPVVQAADSDFYLEHDFYKNANINGQIILDTKCDPYTPSYNLIISGHHMKNGSMFGDLPEYRRKEYWETHKFIEFDTLMFRKWYVIFAAFYSADYDEDEEGFRYNANIQYAMEARQWLSEIEENQEYETGIDVAFGDEFITLTTCNRARHRNGRFVVVARKIREGETFE